jgi:hypothetical protein
MGASFLQASSQSLGSEIYSRREEPLITRRLHVITRLLSLPMRQWRSVLNDDMSNFNDSNIQGFSDGTRGAVSWLTLRFGENNHLLETYNFF